MSLSSASQLGSIIGGLANQQSQMKEDIIPDEIDQALVITPQENLVVEKRVVITRPSYSGNAFILDHPIYSDLDNSTLLLSGLYENDLREGLVAFYNFHGDATDSSGNGNDGTVTGATLTDDKEGRYNNAYSFPAGNSRINIPSSTDFDIISGVTLSCWVKFKNYTSTGYIFGRYSVTTAANRSALIYKSGGNLRFFTDNGVYATLSTFITASTYNDWMHIVCTNDGTSSKIYINGVLRTTATKALDTGSFSQEVAIGNSHTGSDSSEADISTAGWWNRVLSATEVSRLYMGGYINDYPLKSGELVSIQKS